MELSEEIELYAESAYKATVTVRDFLQSEVVPVLHAQIHQNLFEQALVGLYFRMVLWSRTLATLDNPESFQAVRAGARAAFELHLDIHHLASNPELAEKIFAFSKVWKYYSAKKLLTFLSEHPELDGLAYRHQKALASDAEKRKECEALIDKFWPSGKGTRKVPSDWSGKDIYGKACDAGTEFAASDTAMNMGLAVYLCTQD